MFGDWCGVWSQAGEDWAADGSTPGQDVEEERRQTEQSGLRPGPPHPLPLLPHSPQQGHRPDQQLRRQADIWTLLSAAVSHRPASDLVELEIELVKVVIQARGTWRPGR